MILKIAQLGQNETVAYAVSELMRVLKQMDENTDFHIYTYFDGEDTGDGKLIIGQNGSCTPSELDDEIKIDVTDGVGVITGSNPRSVLIAVYRFLRELGCRWLRPGADGEFIPRRELCEGTLSVKLCDKPSCRHRSICYEGYDNTFDNVKSTIEWLPRVGMNGYFIQCIETGDEDRASRRSYARELKKRGLIFHAAGHGINCEPLGFHLDFDDAASPLLTPEVKRYFALVGGKREMVKRMADTQLCYSDPEVVKLMNSWAMSYIREHRDIDYFHYWLGDGTNNFCLCDNCKKHRPSDFYIGLLNDLDERMTAEGIDMKVVFLIYSNLMWAPEVAKLKNPARFTMMYAPIARKYTHALCDSEHEVKEPFGDYNGNESVLPKSVSANVEALEAWQNTFSGDSFVFDYHLIWDHMLDPGYMTCARVLHRDMATLDRLGLGGMVSCQVQRAAFPTGLPQYAMAAALWDKNSDFEEVCRDYFETAFGEDAATVRAYLEGISELFDPAFMRNDHPEAIPTAANRALAIKETVAKFNVDFLDENAGKSADLRYLALHAGVCERYADLIYAYAALGEEERTKAADELERYNNEIVHDTRYVLDVPNFNGVFRRWIIRAFRLHTRPYGAY